MLTFRSKLSRALHRASLTWDYATRESALPRGWPRGHFYSPLPDVRSASAAAAKLASRRPADGIVGVDLRTDEQGALLSRMKDLYDGFDWPDKPTPRLRFHFDQDWYKHGDSIALYSMLRLFKPSRVIEVGAGFSSALMLDVNERFLNGAVRFTFIEPYPDRLDVLLSDRDRSRTNIIRHQVQNASAAFSELHPGDFLFIDSSHVSRAGSDVNFLLFEILPNLPRGVFIHFHDIFWPFEYPPEWIAEGSAWNEAYILRAFLTFNKHFEIVFWVPFAAKAWPEVIERSMPRYMQNTGAAIWLRKTA